jgi:transcription initiation factor TFIID subunit 9B
MSKDFLLGTAQQRNNVTLLRVLQNEWGVRLQSERFVLTGVPWTLKSEWWQNRGGRHVLSLLPKNNTTIV